MNGGRSNVTAEYKYLGCVISEHLDGKRMLEERTKTGARVLSACVALVESVLLYGAEVWGCGRQALLVEQVQLRAAKIFLGMGRLHLKVAVQFEMRMMPVRMIGW